MHFIILRLEHTNTNKNLHVTKIKAALSQKYEISSYGDNGFGNEYDHF